MDGYIDIHVDFTPKAGTGIERVAIECDSEARITSVPTSAWTCVQPEVRRVSDRIFHNGESSAKNNVFIKEHSPVVVLDEIVEILLLIKPLPASTITRAIPTTNLHLQAQLDSLEIVRCRDPSPHGLWKRP